MNKKVIIITHIPFWRVGSGDKARLLALANFLSKTTILTIGYIGEREDNPIANSFRIVHFANRRIASLSDIITAVKEYMASNTFDACIIEFAFLSFLLPYLSKDMLLILDSHDIVSDRAESFMVFGRKSNNLTDLTRKEEYDYFMKYDYVVVIKKADCDKVSAIIGREKVILARHPASGERQPIRNPASNIGYVASCYSPNIDAINWFLNEVWPHVSYPQITLNIFGSVAEGVSNRIPSNVRKIGMVADIDQIYRDLDIVINPVRFGAGLKIKNIEALARGLPLVTTPHGADGIEDVAGTAFLVAQEPREFGRHIDTLMRDAGLRRRLGDEAYRYAGSFLSEDCCFDELLSKINKNPEKVLY